MLLTGVSDIESGAAPPSVYWSPTDIQTPSDWAFTNPSSSTPLTIERVDGTGLHCGRANVGVAQGLGDKTFYVTVDNEGSALFGIGLANSSQSLSAYLGGSANSICLFKNGDLDYGGVTTGGVLGGYVTGDVIGVRVNTTANTVQFNKNGGSWTTATTIASLGEVAIYPAHFTQAVGQKMTADFSGLA